MIMNNCRRSLALAGLIVAVAASQAVLLNPSTALAARSRTQTAELLPMPGPDSTSADIANFLRADAIPVENVCCLPIRYRALPHNRCFGCDSVKITLLVEDPNCCGCFVKVPVCIPVCCQGEPRLCAKPGVLGRRRVSYQWHCGFAVEVIFRTRGDLVVLY